MLMLSIARAGVQFLLRALQGHRRSLAQGVYFSSGLARACHGSAALEFQI